MKAGDLVGVLDRTDMNSGAEVGIVIRVIRDVEIPPLIEVMWDNGHISRTYQDELEVLNESCT